MKSEVIRPRDFCDCPACLRPQILRPRRRFPLRRALVGAAIGVACWTVSRVLEGLERADRQAEMRGPCCTGTEYYEPAPVVPECRYGEWLVDARGFSWRCGP